MDSRDESVKREVENFLYKNDDKPELQSWMDYEGDSIQWFTKLQYVRIVAKFMNHMKEKGTDVEDYCTEDYTKYISNLQCAVSHKICTYSALKKFSKYLYMEGTCFDDMMENVKKPKAYESVETVKKREEGFLTTKQVKKCLKCLEERTDELKTRDKAIFLILLTTGLRESAVIRLNISDVDFENMKLTTIEKGNKIREKSIDQKCANAIKEYLEYRESLVSHYWYNDNEESLFLSEHGKRLDSSNLQRIVKRITEKCGKSVSPHKIRATYGTLLYDKTKDIYFVQQAMGHASPTTTERYIRGKSKELEDKATSIMSNLFSD